MQLLPRQTSCCVPTSMCTDVIRRKSELKAASSGRQVLSCHKHRGLDESPVNVCHGDGVLLNAKCFRSEQGAVKSNKFLKLHSYHGNAINWIKYTLLYVT